MCKMCNSLGRTAAFSIGIAQIITSVALLVVDCVVFGLYGTEDISAPLALTLYGTGFGIGIVGLLAGGFVVASKRTVYGTAKEKCFFIGGMVCSIIIFLSALPMMVWGIVTLAYYLENEPYEVEPFSIVHMLLYLVIVVVHIAQTIATSNLVCRKRISHASHHEMVHISRKS